MIYLCLATAAPILPTKADFSRISATSADTSESVLEYI